MRIVALFSIDTTSYDQPSHNLVAFWDNEPDLKKLAAATNVDLGKADGDVILSTVNLWQKMVARIQNTIYWWDWIDSDQEMPAPPDEVNNI